MKQPTQPQTGFFAGLIERPVTLLVLFIALLVVGGIAYSRIPLLLMPDGMVEPGLWVDASNPNASAQENEEKVARPLEEQLRTMAGVERISSTSHEHGAGMWVAFDANIDMDLAKAEVRDRIERARAQLPDTVTEVGIYSFSTDSFPIMWMAMLHPGDSERTDFLVENVITRRLESVDGVGKLDVEGALADSVRILLDENRVRAANLDIGALIRRLSSDNFALPMGEVTDGGTRILLRSDMRFETTEEIEHFPIESGLELGDIARVIQAKSVRNRLFKINGSYAFFGAVYKDSQANTVATCQRLAAALEDLESDPRLAEFEFLPLWNQGEVIEDSLNQLKETAVWGGGLAVIVLLVFLRRIRTTLAVSISIPFSVILAIAVLYFSGGTFNVLTMCGITLALGMLVDNSVVVMENIARLGAAGMDRREASVRGTRDVALAVALATLTTVAVFMPMIFMTKNPMMRMIFAEIGLPLCLALIFSLLAALVFLPVIASRVVGPRPLRAEGFLRFLRPVTRIPVLALRLFLGVLQGSWFLFVRAVFHVQRLVVRLVAPWPARLLLVAGILGLLYTKIATVRAAAGIQGHLEEFGLDLPPATAAITTMSVLAGLACLIVLFAIPIWRGRPSAPPARPASFLPAGDSAIDFAINGNRAMVEWSLNNRFWASGLAVLCFASIVVPATQMTVTPFGEDEDTGRLTLDVELEENFTLWEADQEMIHYEEFFATKQEQYGFENIGVRFNERGGSVSLYWEAPNTTERLEELRQDVVDTLVVPPGHTVRYFDEDTSEETRNKNIVTWRLTGPDSEELEGYGLRAIALLEGLPGLNSVKSPLEGEPGQVRVVFDAEQANTLGVTADQALQNISWALRGWQLPRFQEEGREVPLFIEYDEEQLAGLSTLRDLEIFTGEAVVPLASFAELQFGQGSRRIRRRNGQVSFTIQGRVDNPLLQRPVSDAGYELLRRELDLPRGYTIGEDLVSRRGEEELSEMRLAMLLSMVLVFLLMAILFESLLLPFSVLFTIPFSWLGAFWTLYLTGTTMDSIGWIGMIILVGVVVNNGIVLVDRIHSLRGQGLSRSEAVLAGCGTRVRPILMTALTTVIGLMPMIFSEASGSGIDYHVLAICVAGGLAISTFFTLWVVPLAYTVFDDFGHALSLRRSWALRPAASASSSTARPASEPA